MYRMTEAEMREAEQMMREYEKREERKFKNRMKPFFDVIKYFIFKPLIMMLNIIAVVCKLAGSVGCIGAVYSLYLWYKVIVECRSGVALPACFNFGLAMTLFVFPFIAYLIFGVCAKIADALDEMLPII